MKCRKAYGIMPVGENDRSAHVAQQKAPEVATPGLFYSVLGGWLNPKAGYQLFFSVQPFADVVGNYTCQNSVLPNFITGFAPTNRTQYPFAFHHN